ncbi:MAG: arylamine N-acetyltransferase [Streptosporangiales bacterium]|nr:arylamine N-acetyltransferase [Streptosporangiales bacterium]
MTSHARAVDRYLSRLGFASRPGPTAETLVELQRRHLDLVPYENLAAALGRPDLADPAGTLERIAAGGNAGYCFHHNGALELVLRDLGFTVERRLGHIDGDEVPELNHLVLLVTIGGRRWWPDLGLGDALRDPVEVSDGKFRQGPFRYAITASDPDAGTWIFRHDPAWGSFTTVEVRGGSPSDADIAASHRYLSTPPEGRYTRTLVVARLEDTGADVLRGIRLRRHGDGARARNLETYEEWRAALTALRVSLAGVSEEELRSLHGRLLAFHSQRAAGKGLDPHVA